MIDLKEISYREALNNFCTHFCLNDPMKIAVAESAFYACHQTIMAQLEGQQFMAVVRAGSIDSSKIAPLVRVCSVKDRECGDNAVNWCGNCPKWLNK